MINDRFQRTTGIVAPETLERIAEMHVLVAGVGGTGGQAAMDLTRMGFGILTLSDFDVYEVHNSNRQIGCFESTVGTPKVDVIARMCRDANPGIKLRVFPEGVNEENVPELVRPTDDFPPPDYVIEVMDLAGIEAKRHLYRACRDSGIIVLTGLMTGFGATVHVFHPDAPLYEELYITDDGGIDFPKIVPRLGSYILSDYVERCFDGTGHIPTCGIGAITASAMIVSEIMRGVILGNDSMANWPQYLYSDFFDRVHVLDARDTRNES
jgi:molybdopterin/thiamine biosynthesis adenylyltransferase